MKERPVYYNANKMLEKACKDLGIDLCILIAETGFWADPKVVSMLKAENGTSCSCWFPKTRRKNNGEKRGKIVDGIKLDDNTYANNAIKRALGFNRKDVDRFATSHIWQNTSNNPKCHTAIPNLVLLPRPLASLSDYDERVQMALQFRSFELYGWYPPKETKPKRPKDYPKNWKPPFPFSDRIAKSIKNRRMSWL